jgi:hemerythrin superfamily protein
MTKVRAPGSVVVPRRHLVGRLGRIRHSSQVSGYVEFMDAITLLKDDHKTVEKLFKRFEKAGKNAHAEKRQIADRICEELSKHAVIEETLFYPVTRATVPETEDIALESLEEHHIVKWVLSEVDDMEPADERFDAKMTVLIENVRHHVEEEEGEYFPMVRKALGRNALRDLGDAMKDAKATAPTHPHPRAPDTPPGNIVAGATAAAVDLVGDTVSGLAQGSLSAGQDLIAKILGTQSEAKPASGTSTARGTAKKVRQGAKDATKKAESTAAKAKRTGKAATAGAKGTATSAKRGAKSTTTAAKRGAKNTSTTAKKAAGNTKSTAKRGATTTSRKAKAKT